MAPTANTKTVQISTSNDSITLGGVQIEEDWNNELNSFNRPDLAGGSPETRALNLNQVEDRYKITASMDDEVTDALNSSDDTLETKEDAYDRIKTIAESGLQQTLTWGSRTIDGYITKMSIEETADDDLAGYEFTIAFLEATPMNQ